jgi:hypothetical protein
MQEVKVQKGAFADESIHGESIGMDPVKRQRVSENPTNKYSAVLTNEGSSAVLTNEGSSAVLTNEGNSAVLTNEGSSAVSTNEGGSAENPTMAGMGAIAGITPGTFPNADDFPGIACVEGQWGAYEECKSAATQDLPTPDPPAVVQEVPPPSRLWAVELLSATKVVGSTVLEATIVVVCIHSNRLPELLYEQIGARYDGVGYDWSSYLISYHTMMFMVLFSVSILLTKLALKQVGFQSKQSALTPCGSTLILSPCAWWCVVELVRAAVVQMGWFSTAEMLGGVGVGVWQ